MSNPVMSNPVLMFCFGRSSVPRHFHICCNWGEFHFRTDFWTGDEWDERVYEGCHDKILSLHYMQSVMTCSSCYVVAAPRDLQFLLHCRHSLRSVSRDIVRLLNLSRGMQVQEPHVPSANTFCERLAIARVSEAINPIGESIFESDALLCGARNHFQFFVSD